VNPAARILVALAASGRDRAWLVKRTRLGVNTIARLLQGSTADPLPGTLAKVADALGVSTSWLAAGGAPQRALGVTEAAELQRALKTLRAIALGQRIDARADPNVRPEPKRRVPGRFRRAGARQVYRVQGPSLMRFGLLDRDLVYVKPEASPRATAGKIALVTVNGALYLKRLTIGAGGVVTLLSACDGYDPLIIRPGDDFTVMGQAVAAERELT
jgi:SOS-response transcriptional repressor LexA